MNGDSPLRHLPQSPRPAQEADIVQLAPDGLAKLFDESRPTPRALTPAEARVALGMHRAGRDAAAIAERTQAPVAAVMAFLDSLKARAAKPPQQAAAAEALPVESASVLVIDPEQFAADSQPPPAAAPAPLPKLPPPDVALSDLQVGVIRRLRKARVPAAAIAFGMRLTPDQVQRVVGEIP